MPDPSTHTNIAAPIVGGVVSTIVSRLFDIEIDVLFVAFIGAWIGVALRDAVPEFSSKTQAFVRFGKTLGVIVTGTLGSAWSIPIILSVWPDVAKKSLAALTGFVLVYFYPQIIDLIKFALNVAKGVIERLGGKVGQ